ncbi:subfamily iiic had-superfamily phosphatase, partial [Chrysochromulina tobinii]
GAGAETNRVTLKSEAAALDTARSELDTARVKLDTALEERWRELHERTNQFNAWKRPLPPPAALRSPLLSALAVEVSDRYSAYGFVGAALARPEAADGGRGTLQVLSFCMSCRVLGRGVEHAMMRALGALALELSPACPWTAIGVVDNSRNVPLRRFLSITQSAIEGASVSFPFERARGARV